MPGADAAAVAIAAVSPRSNFIRLARARAFDGVVVYFYLTQRPKERAAKIEWPKCAREIDRHIGKKFAHKHTHRLCFSAGSLHWLIFLHTSILIRVLHHCFCTGVVCVSFQFIVIEVLSARSWFRFSAACVCVVCILRIGKSFSTENKTRERDRRAVSTQADERKRTESQMTILFINYVMPKHGPIATRHTVNAGAAHVQTHTCI